MRKNMNDTKKVFNSINEWEREYLPILHENIKYEELEDNPKSLGITLANQELKRVEEQYFKES